MYPSFLSFPNIVDINLLSKHYVSIESLHGSWNHKCCRNYRRDVRIQNRHNDDFQQLAASNVFVNSSMLAGMVDNLCCSIVNVGTSVSYCNSIDNIVIAKEYMHTPTL